MILKENEELAELVGIYLAAGKIFDDKLVISVDKGRDNYVNHVYNLIVRIFGIKPEKLERKFLVDLIISNKDKVREFKRFLY